MEGATVGACLRALQLRGEDSFAGCTTLDEEWRLIKRSFFALVLTAHPDKGGDVASFNALRTSFEALRGIYDHRSVVRFSAALDFATGRNRPGVPAQEEEEERNGPPPPWEFYEAAATEEIPVYRVELAKSSRATCNKCRSSIEKGEIRFGWLDAVTGVYGGWIHLACWRVPHKVWLGLPDPVQVNHVASFVEALAGMGGVLLSGFCDLKEEHRGDVARHVMQKENWAKPINRGGVAVAATAPAASERMTDLVPTPPASTAVGPVRKMSFVIPSPGKGQAMEGALHGWTCVMTGTFPEIGGGAGLELGKEKVRQMITSFGGRVTAALSGRIKLLVVGKNPGYAKFDKATSLGVKKVSLADLAETLQRGDSIENVPEFVTEMRTRDFSTGFRGNGLAGKLLGPGATYSTLQRAQTEPPVRSTTSMTRVASTAQRTKMRRRKRSRTNIERRVPEPRDDEALSAPIQKSRRTSPQPPEELGGGDGVPPEPPQVPTRSPSPSSTID